MQSSILLTNSTISINKVSNGWTVSFPGHFHQDNGFNFGENLGELRKVFKDITKDSGDVPTDPGAEKANEMLNKISQPKPSINPDESCFIFTDFKQVIDFLEKCEADNWIIL